MKRWYKAVTRMSIAHDSSGQVSHMSYSHFMIMMSCDSTWSVSRDKAETRLSVSVSISQHLLSICQCSGFRQPC